MKRSEAEYILVDKMFEAGLSGFNSREDFVKFFLKAAEEIGMLPPTTSFLIDSTMKTIYPDHPEHMQDSPISHLVENVNKWEPEDET